MISKTINFKHFFYRFFCVLIGVFFMFGYIPLNATDKASTWTQVNVPGPSARHDHAMVYDAIRKKIVVFAGESGSGSELSDQWEWNGIEWEKISVNAPYPYIRTEHAVAYDIKRKRVVLFGGDPEGSWNALGDTWLFKK